MSDNIHLLPMTPEPPKANKAQSKANAVRNRQDISGDIADIIKISKENPELAGRIVFKMITLMINLNHLVKYENGLL